MHVVNQFQQKDIFDFNNHLLDEVKTNIQNYYASIGNGGQGLRRSLTLLTEAW